MEHLGEETWGASGSAISQGPHMGSSQAALKTYSSSAFSTDLNLFWLKNRHFFFDPPLAGLASSLLSSSYSGRTTNPIREKCMGCSEILAVAPQFDWEKPMAKRTGTHCIQAVLAHCSLTQQSHQLAWLVHKQRPSLHVLPFSVTWIGWKAGQRGT